MTATDGDLTGRALQPPSSDGSDRIWTVPNAITICRLFLAGGFVAALFAAHDRALAFVLLGIAGATDFFDGYLARRIGQVTTVGKIIDPSVDRLVLVTAVIASAVYGAIPVWLCAVVVARDALVSGTVLVLAALGAARIDVNRYGKAGTFGLMCAFPLMILGDGQSLFDDVMKVLAWVCAVPALSLLAVATALYIPAAKNALATGRMRAQGSTT
ncbi:MAG: CDP-alcohol phosphatidyltransferase family protein [Acidimicrobiales bacterium]